MSKIALSLDDFLFPNIGIASNEELAEILATNFEMANFEFVDYKTPPKEGWNFVDEIILYGNDRKEIQLGIARGQAIGEAVNATRRLSNTPGGEMTPAILAQEARKAAVGTKVKVTVLDKTEISQLNMGGVIGVSKGSSEEPKFITGRLYVINAYGYVGRSRGHLRGYLGGQAPNEKECGWLGSRRRKYAFGIKLSPRGCIEIDVRQDN
ncbi:MAG: hypothetical protein HYV77_00170 [Candidatus Wildermuthbacteria bacterium]|nr:hypothetical protein [Candidatus Wildermuthbacteria bacterium]